MGPIKRKKKSKTRGTATSQIGVAPRLSTQVHLLITRTSYVEEGWFWFGFSIPTLFESNLIAFVPTGHRVSVESSGERDKKLINFSFTVAAHFFPFLHFHCFFHFSKSRFSCKGDLAPLYSLIPNNFSFIFQNWLFNDGPDAPVEKKIGHVEKFQIERKNWEIFLKKFSQKSCF